MAVEVNLQWLDLSFSITAALCFILAALNSFYLLGYARAATTRARAAGAAALIAVEAGVALEALLFLSQSQAPLSWTRAGATAIVRAANLIASALVGLLIWRARREG